MAIGTSCRVASQGAGAGDRAIHARIGHAPPAPPSTPTPTPRANIQVGWTTMGTRTQGLKKKKKTLVLRKHKYLVKKLSDSGEVGSMRATQDLSSVGNPFLSKAGGPPGVHCLRPEKGKCFMEPSPSASAWPRGSSQGVSAPPELTAHLGLGHILLLSLVFLRLCK